MRLIDLDPRWLIQDGKRVGFVFKSPIESKWYQSCFLQSPDHTAQWALFQQALGHLNIQCCRPGASWSIGQDINTAEFEKLTVHPSIDGSAGGLWHGWITNGEIR